MKAPKRNPRRLGCLVHGVSGMTLYCNKAMLTDIVAYLQWMLSSDPARHYECHFLWHIGGGAPSSKKKLFSLREAELQGRAARLARNADITVMLVTSADLARLLEYEAGGGVLPRGWRSGG